MQGSQASSCVFYTTLNAAGKQVKTESRYIAESAGISGLKFTGFDGADFIHIWLWSTWLTSNVLVKSLWNAQFSRSKLINKYSFLPTEEQDRIFF